MNKSFMYIFVFLAISLILFPGIVSAKFPKDADEFIMYSKALYPFLSLGIKDLVISGTLSANETIFTNTTVININVTNEVNATTFYEDGQDISDKYVPYTGATKNVDLSPYSITTKEVNFDGEIFLNRLGETYIRTWPNSIRLLKSVIASGDSFIFQSVPMPGFNNTIDLGGKSDFIWNDLYLGGVLTDLSNNLTIAQLMGINNTVHNNTFVPYTEATKNVDLGTQDLDTSGTGTFGYVDITAEGLDLLNTRNSTSGIIWKEGSRLIHNFRHLTGGTAVPAGHNIFVGKSAGNLNMGSTATASYHASYNTGIGSQTLYRNRLGNENMAIGYKALYENLDGNANAAIGYKALYSNTAGSGNMAIGTRALYYHQAGHYNIGIGSNAGKGTSVHTNEHNTFIGAISGYRISTGSSNLFLGYRAGSRQTTNSNLLIIDNRDRADVATESNSSIIYGVMAADPADQNLTFNADVHIQNLEGSYTGGNATVCVWNNGSLYASDGGC